MTREERAFFVERTAHDLFLCARDLSVAPVDLLTANREAIEEAREHLNDALAKIARHAERKAA